MSGSVLVMAVDMEIKRRVGRDTEQDLNQDIWDVPTQYGNAAYAGTFALATYGTGLVLGNDEIRVTGRLLIEGLSMSGVLAIAIRYVTGRSRPHGNNHQWDFNWFQTSKTYQSFPSGHAVVSFAVSTVLAERINNTWARIGFYGLASLTAIARVYNSRHWASDVIAGAGLGLLGGLFVVNREKEREQSVPAGSSRLQLQPTANGVRVVYLLR
jgi:membrane-associated phospholipid phosphatase